MLSEQLVVVCISRIMVIVIVLEARVTTYRAHEIPCLFPDFSSRPGKDSSMYCLTLWSTVVASH